ncbi:uroporphyrinogen decarboxylase [Candidatus Atelocyanobacterium thalassae]|jgi:uroporphyrinogen decarboxylase|uniref:Uroporphyrinogen decarboxylase n=1 Tax=Atelocyanobacterium thalassa (isolate ALOHA) TaxID=1453429 RepID=D3ENM8_ATETH|nr:uroporphyrinogen decarboxylase [Candidatus Atelocyanobacterium thalassa]ADB95078.1 uroporphyrinogen decarboxylase [Candidatus Atelocyanobacterium thalassa isolate ALOHA]MCH2543428.1 uroporphyrinogen decarboxylase [Candidatus Atelocyanobacterium sp. ALOHA_A2.5_9]|tara:strand:+ start:77700 stop:78764 length:1065 start_codon:yes stop_codon:yes gene_type:complete
MKGADNMPYLLRAARGEILDRPPVWMMRQAGRYMKVYRDLRDRYPSFRERSENPNLAIEISLQPWHAFQPDGVIMFSDILTPLSGMGVSFDIIPNKGPVISPAIRTLKQIEDLHDLEPEESLPFVKTILQSLRKEVGNQSTVLGFVGAPWTLAAYAIEGKSSKNYTITKAMAFSEPEILHRLLSKITNSIATYACHQIACGAQIIQLFDSWAGHLSPQDYESFALPYQQQVIHKIKKIYPDTPVILYINSSAGKLNQMECSKADIVSIDWTIDMAEARQRLSNHITIQGNIDPGILFGSHKVIKERIIDTVQKAGKGRHILNLGHGVVVGTPEENVRYFFEIAKQIDKLTTLTI